MILFCIPLVFFLFIYIIHYKLGTDTKDLTSTLVSINKSKMMLHFLYIILNIKHAQFALLDLISLGFNLVDNFKRLIDYAAIKQKVKVYVYISIIKCYANQCQSRQMK